MDAHALRLAKNSSSRYFQYSGLYVLYFLYHHHQHLLSYLYTKHTKIKFTLCWRTINYYFHQKKRKRKWKWKANWNEILIGCFYINGCLFEMTSFYSHFICYFTAPNFILIHFKSLNSKFICCNVSIWRRVFVFVVMLLDSNIFANIV